MAARVKNRIKSRIDELPEDARAFLDENLANVLLSYQEISDAMVKHGWIISKSSIGRYALRQNSAAQRLREAREQTTALLSIARENQDIAASELATSLMIDGLVKRIATAEEEFDEMPLEKAGKLVVQLQRSAVYKERMRSARKQACKDVEALILKRIREAIRDDKTLLGKLEEIVSAAAIEEADKDDDR